MSTQTQPSKNRQTIIAILWICSGIILLVAAALLQTLFHWLVPQPLTDDTSSAMTIFTIVNLISLFAEMVGVILIPIGIIVGVIKLSKL